LISAAAAASQFRMSVKATEVFPDLHHKMSKKIAQLTKVIYHLNTRNEDHQADLELIQSNHQVEIQQILKDAANRINSFKEAVETKQGELNQDTKLKALQSKHEKERQAAKSEFGVFKEKAVLREANIAGEFEKKFSALQENVESMNKKFLEKVKSFESSTETLNKALKAAQSDSSSSMKEAQAAYEKELADLVKSSNEKYQKLMMEQMLLQENLREEMQRRIEETKVEVTNSLQQERETALGQLRAKLNGDKQEELMTQKREYDHDIQKVKTDLMEKLEKALSDMKVQKEMFMDQIQGKEEIEKGLRDQIEALQSGFSSSSGILEEQVATLKAALGKEQEQSHNLTQQLDRKTTELTEAEEVCLSLTEEIRTLKRTIEEMDGDLKQLRDELQKRGTLGAEAETKLKKQLVDADKEANALRKEVAKLTDTVNGLKTDITKKDSAAQELAVKHKSKVKTLEDEVSSLTSQLKDIRKNASKDSDKTMKEMNDLRKQMAKMEADHKKTLEDKNIQHQAAISEAVSAHKAETAALQRRIDELERSGADKERTLQEEMKQLEASHVAGVEKLRTAHSQEVAGLQAGHAEEVETLGKKLAALEAQLSELSSKADGERGSLKSEMTRLEAKTKVCERVCA
jgi:chromosome segregation ATPase